VDRLLLRSTRGLMPTEAGHAFYERAKRAIVIDQAVELVFRHKLTKQDRIKTPKRPSYGEPATYPEAQDGAYSPG
jgi:hypothetical protein